MAIGIHPVHLLLCGAGKTYDERAISLLVVPNPNPSHGQHPKRVVLAFQDTRFQCKLWRKSAEIRPLLRRR